MYTSMYVYICIYMCVCVGATVSRFTVRERKNGRQETRLFHHGRHRQHCRLHHHHQHHPHPLHHHRHVPILLLLLLHHFLLLHQQLVLSVLKYCPCPNFEMCMSHAVRITAGLYILALLVLKAWDRHAPGRASRYYCTRRNTTANGRYTLEQRRGRRRTSS